MNVEILLLAAAAAFVLYRLFTVLGKQDGAPPPAFRTNERPDDQPERPRPVLVSDNDRDDEGDEEELLDGINRIQRSDPSFSQREFLTGAKSAYEMIVQAFADGNHGALVPLLTKSVYNDYDEAIKDREERGDPSWELLRLKSATLEGGDLKGSVAEVNVLFEAELSNGEKVRKTREIWTFERDTSSRDPNWRLADVSAA